MKEFQNPVPEKNVQTQLLHEILEHLTHAIVVLDKNWHYLYINDTAGRILEKDPKKLIGKNIWDIFPDVTHLPFYKAYHQAMETMEILSIEEYYPGHDKWYRNHIYPTPLGLMVYFYDITEEVKAKEAQKGSEDNYRLLLERISDGFVSVDKNWDFTYVNKKAEEIIGQPAENLIGRSIWDESLGGAYPEFENAYRASMTTQEFKKIQAYYPPWDKWFENRIYPSKEGLSILFTDITEQKKIEERIKSYNEQLIQLTAYIEQVREEERKTVVDQVHNELGQLLTVLKMGVSRLLKKRAHSEEFEAVHQDIMGQLDESMNIVRRISYDLRPLVFDDLGLIEALEWQSRKFQNTTGIKTRFTSNIKELQLPGTRSIRLFRIFQETLSNVSKHSNANEVTCKLHVENDLLSLAVSDNGTGFDKKLVDDEKSLGLLSIKERARLIEGTFEIETNPGKGTTVQVVIPLKNMTQ